MKPCTALPFGDHELAHALVAGCGRPEAPGAPPQRPPDGGSRPDVADPAHARPQAGVDSRRKLHAALREPTIDLLGELHTAPCLTRRVTFVSPVCRACGEFAPSTCFESP